jgi:hypothetical protein
MMPNLSRLQQKLLPPEACDNAAAARGFLPAMVILSGTPLRRIALVKGQIYAA